jgi:hypothetical protein
MGSKRVVKIGVKKGRFWVDFGGSWEPTTVLGSKVKAWCVRECAVATAEDPLHGVQFVRISEGFLKEQLLP